MTRPNQNRNRFTLLTSILLFGVVLAACGGGGGSGNTGAAPLTPPAVAVDTGPGTSLTAPDLGAVTVGATNSALPAGWHNGAFMEIYVRGYKDSDGDGKGDLQGLISKLDYLQDLGVKGIWLMPVTDSADKDHGYAVKNYRGIETDYGTMADFEQLLAQAHARGIGVIMDYVFNHSSSEHPLFKNSASSATNPQRALYVWQATKPTGWNIYGADPWYTSTSNNGYYFAGFWSGMPDFNLTNSAAIGLHHDNLRFWLNKGVDGMRFDAVGNLVENGSSSWESQPQNHAIMRDVQQLIHGYSQRYLVCEAPAASQAFAAASSCGGAFAFDLKDHLLRAAQGNVTSIQAVSQYFVNAPPSMATLLANHDGFAGARIWNQMGGDIARYKLAAASYLLLPGTPFIYYGEEVGMANGQGLSGDLALRTPMSWNADKTGFTIGTAFRNLSANAASQNAAGQVGVADSLHTFYKQMLGLRNSLPSIARGAYVSPFVSGQAIGFQRRLDSETTLILINYGTTRATLSVPNLLAGATLVARYGAAANAVVTAAGQAEVNLPGQSVQVFTIQP